MTEPTTAVLLKWLRAKGDSWKGSVFDNGESRNYHAAADRLDKAEQRLREVGELPEKWRGRAAALDLAGLEGCADELEAKLK